jgi:predicted RNA-binding Zn ribbon-like protein
MTNQHTDAPLPVRFGGMQTADGFLFELTGGRLCLDLANTLDDRGTDHPRELLRSSADLFNWARQSRALPGEELSVLERHADLHPRLAASAFARLVTLREHVFAAFSSLAAGTPIPRDSLAAIDAAAGAAAARRRLEPRGCGAAWAWRAIAPPDLDGVLWRVAWSAAELLTSPDVNRVRQCAGAGCRWLFIDTSRNRTRRWCSMDSCGNRAKAQRHYERKK